MTSKRLLTAAVVVIAVAVFSVDAALGQDQAPNLPPVPPNAPPPSLQSPADPGNAALLVMCKTPPAPRGGGPGRAGGRGPAAPPPGPRAYTIAAIPGVIDAGQRWTFVWQEQGNNGDGIVGTDDGALLIAQNDKSAVLKLDPDGRTSTVYSDTHTGGSLSINKK